MLILTLFHHEIPLKSIKDVRKHVFGSFWESDTLNMKILSDAPQCAPGLYVNRIMEFQRGV